MNPLPVHELSSGLHQQAIAGAAVLDRTIAERAAEVRRQPDWIGCDLSSYRLRLAQTELDRLAACRLRFRVFNLELGEGLAASYASSVDQDEYDAICEHLLVQ